MATAATRKLFANVAVADLARSVDFFTRLGFRFDERFTDDQASMMIVGDDAFVMLLVRERFADFTQKPICDSTAATEAILAVSVSRRDEVDALATIALESGGSPAGEPMDHGFMYVRSFNDPDGHLWEVLWMDPAALEAMHAGAAEAGPAA